MKRFSLVFEEKLWQIESFAYIHGRNILKIDDMTLNAVLLSMFQNFVEK